MIESSLPERHVWLRLTQSRHRDAFDMSYAQERGGRWNPPESWPTLYLNDDLATVHAQVRHLFAGRGIDPDDLDDTTRRPSNSLRQHSRSDNASPSSIMPSRRTARGQRR